MLRRVRLFIATSLDGHIAGPGGSLDWLFTDDDYGYDAFIAGVDTLAMGRRTFETVLALDEWPYEGKATWVFSRAANPPLAGQQTCCTSVCWSLLERCTMLPATIDPVEAVSVGSQSG